MKTTLEGNPKDGMLEVRKNDIITTRYADQRPAAGTRDPVHSARIIIQSSEGARGGRIDCEREVLAPIDEDKTHTVLVQAVRIPNGTRVQVTVHDRGLDDTDNPDTVKVAFRAYDKAVYDAAQTSARPGAVPVLPDTPPALEITLTETDGHSGEFTGAFIVAATTTSLPTALAVTAPVAPVAGALPRLPVKPGVMVTATYQSLDLNEKPIPVSAVFRVNVAENAVIGLSRQIIELPPPTSATNLTAPTPPKITWMDTDVLVPGSRYRVTVTDGDVVPAVVGTLISKVTVKAADGATAEVPLFGSVDPNTFSTVFTGDLFVRLGDAASPPRAYFSQTGEGAMSLIDVKEDAEDVSSSTLWSVPALNVQGKDTVTMTYLEPLTADMKPNIPKVSTPRVADDAVIAALDAKGNPLAMLKPGMSFELQVTDPNGDITPKPDTLKVTLASSCGDKLDAVLTETDAHSGIFSETIPTVYAVKSNPTNAIVEVPFDGKITLAYRDEETIIGTPTDRTDRAESAPADGCGRAVAYQGLRRSEIRGGDAGAPGREPVCRGRGGAGLRRQAGRQRRPHQ